MVGVVDDGVENEELERVADVVDDVKVAVAFLFSFFQLFLPIFRDEPYFEFHQHLRCTTT